MNCRQWKSVRNVLRPLLLSNLILAGYAKQVGSVTGTAAVPSVRDGEAGVAFVVNSTADSDDGICGQNLAAGQDCTLREAINAANTHVNSPGARDFILFAIPGSGVHTISAYLPIITDPVILDGYTQPGAQENTLEDSNNAVLRIELDGSSSRTAYGLVISSGNTTIRGLIINGFDGSGIVLANTPGNTNNLIEGCFIGTDAEAQSIFKSNGGFGITTNGARASDNTIGGTTPAARNIISGNLSGGIFLSSPRNIVQGNFIGTDRVGTGFVGNYGAGVSAYGSNNLIGGMTPETGNVIAFSAGAGVVVAFDQTGNLIRSNRIYDNGSLGVDLGSDRVNVNDPGDGDTGANDRQNFPVLSLASFDPGEGNLIIQGILNSSPNTAFAVEFFLNDTCDDSGHGEGQVFLGSITVTTDTAGDKNFNEVVHRPETLAGQFITATATDTNGSTSEFAPCVQISVATPIPTPTATPTPTPAERASFTSSSYSVDEGAGRALITVKRSGNSSRAYSVEFRTIDHFDFVDCSLNTGRADQRCDYIPRALTLNFLANETTKTFPILIIDDAYLDGDEAITLNLINPEGLALTPISSAELTITDNDVAPASSNPIDEPQLFVRQQYLDFLDREPDSNGLAYWIGQITQCDSNVMCFDSRRVAVSAAFFVENEFQRTGSFVYRLYKGGLGRKPDFASFTADRSQVIEGPTLESTKLALAVAFVQRHEFLERFAAKTTADLFVDALIANIQHYSSVDLSSHRPALINRYNAGSDLNQSRAFALRDAIDRIEFIDAEYHPSFVLMQYFGYLRRDIDQGGHDFWLAVLKGREPGNFGGMVCAFLTSAEYQERFSPVRTRADQLCANIGP